MGPGELRAAINLNFQENKNKINFEEFCDVVGNMDIHKKMVLQV